jgi:hypothetical protein
MDHPNHQIGINKWKFIADWKVIDINLDSDFTTNTGLLSVLNNLSNA